MGTVAAGAAGFAGAVCSTRLNRNFQSVYAYDPFGRRIGKTVGGVATGYVYDGQNFVQEKNGTASTATPTANLVTGLGFDETFARMTGSGASAVVRHPLADGNNNTVRLRDDAGAYTDIFTYEPYGKTTHTGADSASQQYTGRENDNTGLYYYRARYYHPTVGRFVSEDPIGLRAGPNVYAYVDGNPISLTDPTGKFGWVFPTVRLLLTAGGALWAGGKGFEDTRDYQVREMLSDGSPNSTAQNLLGTYGEGVTESMWSLAMTGAGAGLQKGIPLAGLAYGAGAFYAVCTKP